MKDLKKEAEQYLIQGNSYRESKQYQKAIEFYTIAIQYDSRISEAYFARGTVYMILNMELEKSLKDFEKSIELLPENHPWTINSYASRGVIYQKHFGQYQKAIEEYTKAIQLIPYRLRLKLVEKKAI